MAVKLSETDLPQLFRWLEENLPQSFKIHGELKNRLRGQNPNLDFFVDRWPQPQAAVAVINAAGQERTGLIGQTVMEGVFGLNDEALKKLLKDPDVASWDSNVVFAAPPDRLEQVLKTVAQEKGKTVIRDPVKLLKATAQDLESIPVPEGVKFQPVSSAGMKIIHSTWNHADKAPEGYVQQYLERYPSMYLVTDSGQHVGHMVGYSCGVMGMLFVEPEFRRKGYGKIIVSHLAQKYFEQGDDAFVFIENDNVISHGLHKSLAFKADSDSDFLWMFCI